MERNKKFDAYLDKNSRIVKFMGGEYMPSYVLYELDPTKYQGEFSNWVDRQISFYCELNRVSHDSTAIYDKEKKTIAEWVRWSIDEDEDIPVFEESEWLTEKLLRVPLRDWWDLFEALPPENWHTEGDLTYWQCPEFLSGTLTTYGIRKDDTHYFMTLEAWLSMEQLKEIFYGELEVCDGV